MVVRLIKDLTLPALFAALLLLWHFMTSTDFHFFPGLILFFILAFLLNLILRKKLGISYHLFLYLYLFLTIVICSWITPSPYAAWQEWESLSKHPAPVRLSEIQKFPTKKYFRVTDALTIPQSVHIQRYSGKGDFNGARGIVPVVDHNYASGDPIYFFAAFTTYVGDAGINGWFILDKDEDDYREDWNSRIISLRIISDTSRISTFRNFALHAKGLSALQVSSEVCYVQINFPQEDFEYMTHVLTALGLLMLSFAALLSILAAFKTEKKSG